MSNLGPSLLHISKLAEASAFACTGTFPAVTLQPSGVTQIRERWHDRLVLLDMKLNPKVGFSPHPNGLSGMPPLRGVPP